MCFTATTAGFALRSKNQILAIFRDTGATPGPDDLDLLKPATNLSPKETVSGIPCRAELL